MAGEGELIVWELGRERVESWEEEEEEEDDDDDRGGRRRRRRGRGRGRGCEGHGCLPRSTSQSYSRARPLSGPQRCLAKPRTHIVEPADTLSRSMLTYLPTWRQAVTCCTASHF